ncbi:DUF3514 domain-containing protein [Ehrlichia canis]|nr:DUF3514 domain-containing protein [Ehrlichia canis]
MLLTIVSFIGGAAASALLRLITSNTSQDSDKVSGKNEPGSNEESSQEFLKAGQDQAKAGDAVVVSVLQMQGRKKKKRSRHSKQIVQRTDKTSQQSAKDDADTVSDKDAKKDKDTREGSGKEVQSVDSEKGAQCIGENGLDQLVQGGADTVSDKDAKKGKDTREGSGKEVQSVDSEKGAQCIGENGLDQSKQLSSGNISSLQVQGGKKNKHSKRSRQIVQRTDKTSQQSAKDDADTVSDKDAKKDKDTREGSGKEVQSVDSEKGVQETGENGLDQSKQLSSGNISSLQVQGGKKNKHSKRSRQIVQRTDKTSQQSAKDDADTVSDKDAKKDKDTREGSGKEVQLADSEKGVQCIGENGLDQLVQDGADTTSDKDVKKKASTQDPLKKDEQLKSDRKDVEGPNKTVQSQQEVNALPVKEKVGDIGVSVDHSSMQHANDQQISVNVGSEASQYLLLGARPKVRVGKTSKSKKSKEPAVKFYDWSSKNYRDKDPFLVQAVEESRKGRAISNVVTTQTSEKVLPAGDFQVEQKHVDSATDISVGLGVSQQPGSDKVVADESLLVEQETNIHKQCLSLKVVSTHEQDIVSIVEQVSLDELGAAVRIDPAASDQGIHLEESSLVMQEDSMLTTVEQVSLDNLGAAACVVPVETSDRSVQERKASVKETGNLSTHVKSVGISKVASANGKRTLHKNILSEFIKSSAKSAVGEDIEKNKADFKQRICVFKAIHFEYCRSIGRELFEEQRGKILLRKGIISFIKRVIPNRKICTFIFKLAYMLNCMEMVNRPDVANSMICNLLLYSNQSLLDENLVQIVQCVQSGANVEEASKVLHGCCFKMANCDHEFYDGEFFRNVLDVFQKLMLFRLVGANCPKKVLDLVIVKCAMIIGTMYTGYRCFIKSQGGFSDDESIAAIIEHMYGGGGDAKTKPHAGRVGVICCNMLVNLMNMYDPESNGIVQISGICFPEKLICQCSEHLSNEIERNMAEGTMGYEVIMENLAMCLYSTIENFDIAACREETEVYSAIYNEIIRSSGVSKGKWHNR